MRRLYGARFAVHRPERRLGVVMSDTQAQMWAWAFDGSPPPGGWREGRQWIEQREVETDVVRQGDSDLRELLVTEPHPGDPSGKWRWTADLIREGDHIEFGISLDVVDQVLVDVDPHVQSPDIVGTIADAGGAFAGPVPLRSRPAEVRGEEETMWLVGLLKDAARSVPVVVFTAHPAPVAPAHQYAVSLDVIEEFSRACVGVARVVLLPRPEDTFHLADGLGKELRVFHGAVRVFRPQLNKGVHPRFFPDRVNSYVLRGLAHQFVKEATNRYQLFGPAAALIAERQRSSQQADVRTRLGAVTDLRDQVQQYGQEVDRLLAEEASLKTELSLRDGEIAEHRFRIAELESEVTKLGLENSRAARGYQIALERAKAKKELASELMDAWTTFSARLQLELESPEPPPPEGVVELEPVETMPPPESIEEAVIRAQDKFEGTVHITDAAAVAAGRLNPNNVPPTKLWAALEALDQVARMWQADELPSTGRSGALKQLGFPLAHVSDTAFGKFAHEYEFTHGGVRVRVDEHIRIGDKERIYWYEDGLSRQFVVNHIGSHLRDDSSG